MDIRVKVTQDDIKNGKRCLSRKCPLALAVARATGKSAIVRVTTLTVDNFAHRFNMSKKLIRFINDFDSDRPVKPFSFILRFRETA